MEGHRRDKKEEKGGEDGRTWATAHSEPSSRGAAPSTRKSAVRS